MFRRLFGDDIDDIHQTAKKAVQMDVMQVSHPDIDQFTHAKNKDFGGTGSFSVISSDETLKAEFTDAGARSLRFVLTDYEAENSILQSIIYIFSHGGRLQA